MRKCYAVFPLLIAGALVCASSAESADNAALLYWQATALMPPLDSEQRACLDNWKKTTLGPQVMRIMDATGHARRCLLRAATVLRCNWGVNLEDGPSSAMPHLGRMADLAKLLGLSVRRRFDAGEVDDGIDEVVGLMALGRHVGKDGALISYLAQVGIDVEAVQLVAAHLGEMSGDQVGRLAKGISDLPERQSCVESLQAEKEAFVGWLSRETPMIESAAAVPPVLLSACTGLASGDPSEFPAILERLREEHYAQLARVASLPADREEPIERCRAVAAIRQRGPCAGVELRSVVELLTDPAMSGLASALKSGQKMQDLLKEFVSMYDEIIRLMALPRDQYETKREALGRKIETSANPIVKCMIPSCDKVRDQEDHLVALRSLLIAAMRICRNEELAAAPGHDVFGPIACVRTDDGLTVNSKFVFKGKTVSLHIPTGKAKAGDAVTNQTARVEQSLRHTLEAELAKVQEKAGRIGEMVRSEERTMEQMTGELQRKIEKTRQEFELTDEEVRNLSKTLAKGALDYYRGWLKILHSAIEGDMSAQIAAVVWQSIGEDAAINRCLSRTLRGEVTAILGEKRAEAFLAKAMEEPRRP